MFTHCVEADVRDVLSPDAWRRSLDERLTVQETGVDLDGFVWVVNWQRQYPGMPFTSSTSRTRRWPEGVGIDFHEVEIKTETHRITLVFSDLRVSELPPGYSPFVTDAAPSGS